jgi:hypothetical protein
MKAMTLFLILALSAGLTAQSTLEFNQVKLITTEQTVPDGYVWKVESVLGNATTVATNVNSSSSTPDLPATHAIVINSNTVAIAAQLAMSTNYNTGGGNSASSLVRTITYSKETCTTLPIWLPAGATLASGSNVSGISVIEFAVNP